jgi:hypothetical protein
MRSSLPPTRAFMKPCVSPVASVRSTALIGNLATRTVTPWRCASPSPSPTWASGSRALRFPPVRLSLMIERADTGIDKSLFMKHLRYTRVSVAEIVANGTHPLFSLASMVIQDFNHLVRTPERTTKAAFPQRREVAQRSREECLNAEVSVLIRSGKKIRRSHTSIPYILSLKNRRIIGCWSRFSSEDKLSSFRQRIARSKKTVLQRRIAATNQAEATGR